MAVSELSPPLQFRPPNSHPPCPKSIFCHSRNPRLTRRAPQDADLNAKDSEGRTPLHHAVMHGHLGVVDLLLAKGGARLLLAKDILNCTPVHLAAVQNQVTLIIRLVDALLADGEGRTPLHEVARRRCMQVRHYCGAGAGAGGAIWRRAASPTCVVAWWASWASPLCCSEAAMWVPVGWGHQDSGWREAWCGLRPPRLGRRVRHARERKRTECELRTPAACLGETCTSVLAGLGKC
jgi:hypothetical protein